jgi:hypothetical protein
MSLDYLLYRKGTAARVAIPRAASSDYYGLVQQKFIARVSGRKNPDTLSCLMIRLWPCQRSEDIYWREELAGPHGMNYQLILPPDHNPKKVTALKSHLRRTQDVASISTMNILHMIPFSLPYLQELPTD